DRLLDQDVLAGLERSDRHRLVVAGGRADVHQIDVRVGEQVVVAGVAVDRAEVHDLAGRAEVAADAAPVAGELLRVAGVDRGHDGPAEALGGEVVDHAHEPDARYPDSHHDDGSSDDRPGNIPAILALFQMV